MDNEKTYIYGNEKLLSFFSNAAENGKLAHAYILEGGRGSGKHTLARRLACLLACNSLFDRPCLMCESCRKISEGISPDVIEIGLLEDKKQITVDQIRALRSEVFVKPSEEDVKIFLISDAECMNEPAQNVFLKVLEEPPRGVYFIMLCENSANMLATVKSRAPVLKMQVFSDDELEKYLLEYNKTAVSMAASDPDGFKLIVRISEGKIGVAQRLISDFKNDKTQSKHEKAMKLIELSSEKQKLSDLLVYLQKITKARDVLGDILLYATYAVRDLMSVKKSDGDNVNLLFYANADIARKVASEFTSAGVMRLYEVLSSARSEVSLNLNLNCMLTNLAIELKKAAAV
ncbi:MAG: hypothetical protein IJN17_08165 [Clostridia bacterium]|nr:hypothetical protein [Clostridia bacterium]